MEDRRVEDYCRHMIALDPREGTEVCLYCGLVMDPMVVGASVYRSRSLSPPCSRQLDEWTTVRKFRDVVLREFILDAFAVYHMDTGSLADRVLLELHRIANDEMPICSQYARLSLNKAVDRGRLAFVVWDCLQHEGIPRSPLEVAVTMETSTVYMRKAEKELNRQPSYTPLSNYASRIIRELGLPHWMELAVKEGCWHCEHCLTAPEAMIGALIIDLADYLDPQMSGLEFALTPKDVSQVIGCSVESLIRLGRKVPHQASLAMLDKMEEKTGFGLSEAHQAGRLLAFEQAKNLSRRKNGRKTL